MKKELLKRNKMENLKFKKDAVSRWRFLNSNLIALVGFVKTI